MYADSRISSRDASFDGGSGPNGFEPVLMMDPLQTSNAAPPAPPAAASALGSGVGQQLVSPSDEHTRMGLLKAGLHKRQESDIAREVR